MSAIEIRGNGRRAEALDAAERRKKLILVGLAVVLVALLAFELPKLLKHSSTASSSASTPVAAAAAPTPVVNGSVAASTSLAKRMRAIRRMSANDPFVPLIHDGTSASSSASTSAPASASVSQPAIRFTPSAAAAARAHTKPAVSKRIHVKPAHVKPAMPTAAVILTNGQRQVVGVSQVFDIGDAHFRLVSVTRKAMRIKAVGGVFAGAKQAITVRKGHGVKLANTATGVEYRLRFSAGTNAASTVIPPANATPGAAASASANKN
jgi:hypothetical protein